MGDIWPYGGPLRISQGVARRELENEGLPSNLADILAAIGHAESGLDLHVINNTPATGDYSVGIWQINYFDGLYAERSQLFGTPKQLVQGGLVLQANAANQIYHSQGFRAWSTYRSGDYRQYLGVPAASGSGGGTGGTKPPPPLKSPKPPSSIASDTWSPNVNRTADNIQGAALSNYSWAAGIAALRG